MTNETLSTAAERRRTSRRRRRRWESKRDLLAALTSGFVGSLALAASLYNVYLQRVQIRAQVWPHLTFAHSDFTDFSYNVTNSGVGPARIEDVIVRVDGQVNGAGRRPSTGSARASLPSPPR